MAARILVVEDNPANRELTRYLLACSGYCVLEARDGREGLAMARREGPDLILCDLGMPELDGYQMLAQLRAHPEGANLVAVALSAFSMPHDRETALASGFAGYLSKPIDPETFVTQIEAFLPEHLRLPPPETDD